MLASLLGCQGLDSGPCQKGVLSPEDLGWMIALVLSRIRGQEVCPLGGGVWNQDRIAREFHGEKGIQTGRSESSSRTCPHCLLLSLRGKNRAGLRFAVGTERDTQSLALSAAAENHCSWLCKSRAAVLSPHHTGHSMAQ